MMLRTLLILIVLGYTASCSTPENTLHKIFDPNELNTIDKLVHFYDNFVRSNLDEKSTIDKDYIEFLNTNCPKAIESGDLGVLTPAKSEQIIFFNTLDRKHLSEIYIIHDTVKLLDKIKKEFVDTHTPFSFNLNTQGKYAELLELLAKKNDFYRKYYESVLSCGDLCPSHYAAVLKNYQEMDFRKKEERLVLIVNLLANSKDD